MFFFVHYFVPFFLYFVIVLYYVLKDVIEVSFCFRYYLFIFFGRCCDVFVEKKFFLLFSGLFSVHFFSCIWLEHIEEDFVVILLKKIRTLIFCLLYFCFLYLKSLCRWLKL